MSRKWPCLPKSPYKKPIGKAIKSMKVNRPTTYKLFRDSVKEIRIDSPPDVPNKQNVGAWSDTKRPGIVWLSKDKLEKTSPEKTDVDKLERTLTHETVHQRMGAIPDSPEEEKLAYALEDKKV